MIIWLSIFIVLLLSSKGFTFCLVFIPNIQRLEKLNNQELSVIKGGRKEDEGGLSLIDIGGFDDNKKGNAYIRIPFFKIRLPWW